MNVNKKGEIALTNVVADLTNKGYSVFLPIADHLPIDLIAVNEQMVSKRIQVKYKSIVDNRRICVEFASVVNGKKVPVNLDFVDGYAIFNSSGNEIYYVPKSKLTGKGFSCSVVNDSKTSVQSCGEFLNPSCIWEG